MALQLNEVRLAGNLTRDPIVRFLANENAVAQFGLAINKRWKDKTTGEQKEAVTFVDCEAWGKLAELIGKHFTKGSAVYVAGELKLETWEKEGQKHSKLKVSVDEVKFVESKRDGAAAPAAGGGTPSTAGGTAGAAGSTPAPAPAGRAARPDDEPPF